MVVILMSSSVSWQRCSPRGILENSLQGVLKGMDRQQTFLSSQQVELPQKLRATEEYHSTLGISMAKLEDDVKSEIKKNEVEVMAAAAVNLVEKIATFPAMNSDRGPAPGRASAEHPKGKLIFASGKDHCPWKAGEGGQLAIIAKRSSILL